MIGIILVLISCGFHTVYGLGDYASPGPNYQPPSYPGNYQPSSYPGNYQPPAPGYPMTGPVYGKQCSPIPAYLPSYSRQEADKIAGTWYSYRENILTTSPINAVVNYTLIAKTVDPSTGVPAEAVSVLVSFFNASAPQQCTYVPFVGMVTYDGKWIGDIYQPDNIVPVHSYNLYFNPYALRIFYVCGKYSYGNPTCLIPWFYVNTRKNPGDMTDQERYDIDAIIDRTLAPYCSSAAQLLKSTYTSDKPYCQPPLFFPAAYTSAINGILKAITYQVYSA